MTEIGCAMVLEEPGQRTEALPCLRPRSDETLPLRPDPNVLLSRRDVPSKLAGYKVGTHGLQ